jgi:hypothetical protein
MSNNSPKNTLVENNIFQEAVKNLIDEKYSLILTQSAEKNSFIQEFGLFESLRTTKFLFNYLTKINKKNNIERVFIELLYKSLLETEKAAAGSSFFSFYFTLNFLKMQNEEVDKFNEMLLASLKKDREYLPTSKEFFEFIDEWFCYKSSWYKTFYKEIFNLTGLKSFTSIKQTNSTQLIIEVKNGYRFNGFIPKPFINNITNTVELRDLKIITVDGMIEKSSEIFNILNYSWDTKIPVVIVAQKFSDEVYNVLLTNNLKNKLQVYPFEIETSVDTLNQITDISVVSDTLPVSVLSGESLITKNTAELPSIEVCTIKDGELIIENKKTNKAVENHIRQLIKRKQEKQETYKVIEISDYNRLFDMRIERLLGSIVEIQVPKTWSKMQKNEFISFFDEIFKQLKHYNVYGTISEESKQILNSLPLQTNLFKESELTYQIIHGLRNAVSLTKLIQNSNSLILAI